jgi:hypothetical protein
VIIALDRSDAWAPAKTRLDETLIRALARAHRWKRLLEDGKYRSAGELAEAEGVTRSFVNRLLRLTLLSPDIVEIILDGRRPKGLQLEELTRLLPSKWEEQQQHFPLHAVFEVVADEEAAKNLAGPTTQSVLVGDGAWGRQ